jgi:hypothetical protein
MDVNRTWVCMFPHTFFHCRASGHITRECPVMTDIWHIDVLNKIVCQLGDDLHKLFAHLSTTTLLPA